MNAAILCPGPSLALHAAAAGGRAWDTADVRIAINTAILCHSGIEWWCALDELLFQMAAERHELFGNWLYEAEPPPAIFTDDHAYQRIEDNPEHKALFHRHRRLDALGVAGVKPPPGWNHYSSGGARVLAVFLGATHIDVYGADMAGIGDFLGNQCASNRDRRRWNEERAWLQGIDHWLHERGVTITNHPAPAREPVGV